MSKHSDAFEALLTLKKYCEERGCDDCCFCFGRELDEGEFCFFNDGLAPGEMFVLDDEEQISNRVHRLEQMEIEDEEKHE